jgi:hypothetical protein
VLAPQPSHERLYRHDLVGSCQQLGQQQAFLLPPQHDRAVVSLDLQRPEHQKPHGASVMHPATAEKGRTGPTGTALQPCYHPAATARQPPRATLPTARTAATSAASVKRGREAMHNQHAGLSQLLAEQRITQRHEQAAHARLAHDARRPRHR